MRNTIRSESAAYAALLETSQTQRASIGRTFHTPARIRAKREQATTWAAVCAFVSMVAMSAFGPY